MESRVKPSSRLIGASGNTSFVDQRAMLDGTVFTADWLARMALEGRMYTANAGTGTAPFTGGGAYVNTAPDLDMSVPQGVLVVPVFIGVTFETYGTSLLSEIVAVYGKGGVIAPTSATAVTVNNHRLDLSNNSGVTIVSDGTGATYMTGTPIEFWRNGSQFSISKTAGSATASAMDPSHFEWSALTTGVWPILYDTAGIVRLNLFTASQAPTGFLTITFVVPPITVS